MIENGHEFGICLDTGQGDILTMDRPVCCAEALIKLVVLPDPGHALQRDCFCLTKKETQRFFRRTIGIVCTHGWNWPSHCPLCYSTI